jgi:hypothetical protein
MKSSALRSAALALVPLLLLACGGASSGPNGPGSGGSTGGGSGGASGSGGSNGGGSGGRSGSGGSVVDAGPDTSGTGGKVGSGGASGSGGAGSGGAGMLMWRQASLTTFESYPDPNSEECIDFSGCDYVGQFAALPGVQTEAWVMSHNIAAVHSKDFGSLMLKTIRLRKGAKMIDAVVYDECSDSDCEGCCTENAKPSGFLIDLEKYTFARFGVSDEQVEWACVDCK